jgi:hypothetical protein
MLKSRVKGHDSVNAMLFHNGEVYGIARRNMAAPRTICFARSAAGRSNRKHLIETPRKAVESRLDSVRPVNSNVAAQAAGRPE